MMSRGHYTGAAMAAEFVERYFGDRKNDTYIIDVAAGTGLVGDEVSRRMNLFVRTCMLACMRACVYAYV